MTGHKKDDSHVNKIPSETIRLCLKMRIKSSKLAIFCQNHHFSIDLGAMLCGEKCDKILIPCCRRDQNTFFI